MQDADVLEITVSLGVVETVTDDEVVGDGKANVIALDGLQTTRRLVKQRCQTERFRAALAKNPQKIVRREAGVEDVLDEDHVQSRYVVVQILEHAHLPRGLLRLAVACDGNEINGGFKINLTGQIGEKKTGALEYANQVNALPLEILGDLTSHRANAPFNVGVFDADFQSFFSSEWHRSPLPRQVGQSISGKSV